MKSEKLVRIAEHVAEELVELGDKSELDATKLLVVAALALDFIRAGYDHLTKVDGLGQFIVDNYHHLPSERDKMMIAFSGLRVRSGNLAPVMRLNSVTYNEIVRNGGGIQDMYKMTGLYLASNVITMSQASGKESGEIISHLTRLISENADELLGILKGGGGQEGARSN